MEGTRSSASNVQGGLFNFFSKPTGNAGAGLTIDNVTHFHAQNMGLTSGIVTNQYAFILLR